MNKSLRVIILLAVGVATLALLLGPWQPARAETEVFGSTSKQVMYQEDPTDPPPTLPPPTIPPPTDTPQPTPTIDQATPTEQAPTSTPKPTRTREGGEGPTPVPPTATWSPTQDPTITPTPTAVVTPEPPESGGMLSPMSVVWIALLAGLGIVAMGQFVLRKIR